MGNGALYMEEEYWIDGYFDRFWDQDKIWYCYHRDITIPKFATVRNDQDNDRIYITEKFAKAILRPGRVFDMTKKNDQLDLVLKNIINVKWVKPVYSGPPTSLP